VLCFDEIREKRRVASHSKLVDMSTSSADGKLPLPDTPFKYDDPQSHTPLSLLFFISGFFCFISVPR
jgi:hypothetical protein